MLKNVFHIFVFFYIILLDFSSIYVFLKVRLNDVGFFFVNAIFSLIWALRFHVFMFSLY